MSTQVRPTTQTLFCPITLNATWPMHAFFLVLGTAMRLCRSAPRPAGLLRHCCVLHRHKPGVKSAAALWWVSSLPGEFPQPGRRQLPAGMVS